MPATSGRRRSRALAMDEDDAGSPAKRGRKSSSLALEEKQEGDEQEAAAGDDENIENNAVAPPTPNRRRRASQGEELAENQETLVRESVGSPRRALNAPGKPAEAGIIKRVYVENFMCHPKLTVDLCRNVNFIHGQNGSGKSAILAAIQICLGAGARRTNRARNLKELVRKEASAGGTPSCARIRVTVLNQGTDGYKHDIYGDEITVERTIALNGGFNGFKLLDRNGKERSRDKKDLHEMLDVLNIQVENPVAVLDQEEAKKFLSGKAQDKYNFFLKASELERVDRVYSATMDTLEELIEAQRKVSQSLQSSMERVDRLRENYEQHQELEKLEYKVQELAVKYAWAIYGTHEERHRSALEKLREFEQKAAAKQDELTQAEEAANGPNDEGKEKTQRIKDLSDEAGEQAELKQKLEAQLKETMVPLKQRQRDLATWQKRHQQARRAVAEAKGKLQEVREEIVKKAGSHESEEAQRAEALKSAESELEEARSKVNALKQEYTDAQRAAEEAEVHVTSARQTARRAEQQMQSIERQLAGLESSGNNSLAVFGARVSKVAKMVEDAKAQRKFRGPVEGPIGKYLKIVPGKEMYAELAELALGSGVLDRFVVTNDSDRKLVQEIRHKAGCQQDCGVFQVHNNNSRFNVPGPPVEGIETVASVLSVESDLIFNCLVDNNRIEKIALGKSKDESQAKLLATDASGRAVIRGGKIAQVYFLPKGDMWQVKGGQTSLLSNERKMRKTISVDMSEAIAAAERDGEQCRAELEKAKKEEHRWEGEHTKLTRAWNQANRARHTNDQKINDLIAQIDHIKAEMENAAPNTALDTSVYEDEVQQREEDVAKIEADCDRLKQEIEEMKPAVSEIKGKLDEVSIRNEKILEDLKTAEYDMTQFLETQSQKKDAIQKKRDKLEKYTAAIEQHQRKIDAIAEEMEKALRTARVLHFRLCYTRDRRDSRAHDRTPLVEAEGDEIPEPTAADLEQIAVVKMDKDPKQIESKITRAKQKVEQEREKRRLLNESMEEAYQNYITAQEEIDSKSQEVEKLETTIKELKVDMTARKRRWKQFRKHLEKTTAIKFSELLGLNKYKGELTFDHDSSTLDLCVQKGGASRVDASQTKDVKALSGGERSFTTICLLLALGEKLETPFRIMDEFDVFLDPQVRKLTIKSLIFLAKQMEHRQFIFITPQDLTGVDPDPQLKIFKLRPPARYNVAGAASQQTLNFSQQKN
ncbi:hypothetical protein ACA910_020007 [Epithemia clementina (nom. ined.)]